MRPYEVMIIFDSRGRGSGHHGRPRRALEVVRTDGGTAGTVDRWGKRTLAYEMNQKREGYYVVAEFTAEPKASADLDRFLVLADEVLRHKIMRVPEKRSARPGPGRRSEATPIGDR